ncbi:hypothetical protein GCM10023200_58340 [Actinomycetospora chlora]|uniref:Uncharacterized protein n=1 Tax=Actinomycetospora chlora TaxID=663608 RepID=A0ABP9CRI3_9PSEU
MAERDMTGEERPQAFGLPREPEPPDRADTAETSLARRRADDPPRIGRTGFDALDADLAGLAGGTGDVANLPPWSVRDERAAGTGRRPDRDPVALAAWRRVAERRRRRAAGEALDVPTGDDATALPVAADEPAVVEEPVVEEPAVEPTVVEPTVVEPTVVEPTVVEPTVVEPTDPVETPADEAGELVDVEDGPEDHDPRPGPDPEPVPAPVVRDPRPGPAERPSPPPAARGEDARPGGRPEQGGRHEVLLSLAGRIDDDALSSVRELVAVEDEAGAAELLAGCLLAVGAGVTAREHAVLGRWFAASRVDPELIDALPRDPEADRRDEHRFTAEPPAGPSGAAGGAGDAVARAAGRLPGVQRVRECWRTTPAGSAPGPVPHRVVLVETRSADDCEHVAHHVAHAARELGTVSVEVFSADAELPAYHRAAIRAARPLGTGPTAPEPAGTAPVWPLATSPRTRGTEEVPPFGVPAVFADTPAPTPPEAEPAEPAGERYRTVAEAGRDPLERRAVRRGPVEPDLAPERVEPPARPGPVEPEPRPEPVDAGRIERVVRTEPPEEPAPPAAPDETVAPAEPAPVDVDTEDTAERIAALWRVPPPDEILSDEHPISAWTEGPVGVTFGGDLPTPADTPAPADSAAPVDGTGSVDPDAATGDIPVVRADPPPATGRRSRHSRDETGAFPVPEASEPAPTNGHHHGPEAGDAVESPNGPDAPADTGDLATGPMPQVGVPAAPALSPSGPDSFDSQLSERERELLARLHEELASRERLEADAPDPLLGRPGPSPAPPSQAPPPSRPPAPPGSEETTAPRPRPVAPPGPGRPPQPHPGPASTNGTGTNGHHPGVNGHGLPRRSGHDDEDGTPRDA